MTLAVDVVPSDKSTTVRPIARPPFAFEAFRVGLGVVSRVSPEAAAFFAERMFLSPRRRARPASELAVLARPGLPCSAGPDLR